ncbi:hypothetical protein CoNPh17_CDS0104 [Staphylococcus phage S-CoN_Ph17]|nr:hypothetical protein CoNPh17_CDS0104 [Staphylococcus phage S-CoN_Ph17]
MNSCTFTTEKKDLNLYCNHSNKGLWFGCC